MALFEIKDLSFTYPNQEKPALSHVSFEIEQGDFVAICGKSGCGKSTLIRHFKSDIAPYGTKQGEILYKGTELSQVSIRTQASQIGYVTQNPDNQIVTDKVWHEMAFGLENLGFDLQTMRIRVAEMSSYFGIQNWFHKEVKELSGGQKQILNLASVMAMHPQILVLDEPTSQLDPIAASDFLHTIKKLNTEFGITILIVEHRLEEVFPLCDKILVMDKGKITAYDTPKNIGKNLKDNDMFVTFPAPVQVYAALGQQEDQKMDCPLTIKEGRKWLIPMWKNTGFLPAGRKPPPFLRNLKRIHVMQLKQVTFGFVMKKWKRYCKRAYHAGERRRALLCFGRKRHREKYFVETYCISQHPLSWENFD